MMEWMHQVFGSPVVFWVGVLGALGLAVVVANKYMPPVDPGDDPW